MEPKDLMWPHLGVVSCNKKIILGTEWSFHKVVPSYTVEPPAVFTFGKIGFGYPCVNNCSSSTFEERGADKWVMSQETSSCNYTSQKNYKKSSHRLAQKSGKKERKLL